MPSINQKGYNQVIDGVKFGQTVIREFSESHGAPAAPPDWRYLYFYHGIVQIYSVVRR